MTRRPLARAALLGAALLLHGCSEGSTGPSVTMPTAESHGPWFPIAAGAAHGPLAGQATLDCNACHFDKTTLKPSASFTQFTCTGCHVQAPVTFHDDLAALDAYHLASPAVAAVTARTGQAYDQHDAACRACHPQGIRDGVDHARHFPVPHRDAAGSTVARCADCHVQRSTRQYRVMGCATCHPHDLAANTTAHAAVPDFVPLPAGATQAQKDAASAACARCHGDGVVPVKVADHGTRAAGFQVGGGATHAGPKGALCLTCHPALSTDPLKPHAADFKVFSCVGCHDPVGPGSVDHGNRAALQTFHEGIVDTSVPPTVPPTIVPKAKIFGQVVDQAIAAAGGDAAKGLSAACLQCHPQGIGAHPYYLLPHQNAAKTVVASCQQCHVNDAKKADLGCASCHAQYSPVGPKHARVPDVVASDTSLAASAKCARCHEFDAIPTRPATGHGKFTLASGAHSGPVGGVCLTCHPALKGEPTPWAADFKVKDCVGCHVPVAGGRAQHHDAVTLKTLHAGVTDYDAKVATGLSAACLTCHPTGVAGPPPNHDEYFGLGATSRHVYPSARIKACLDCHTSSNRTNPADFRCAACHAADTIPLATGHAKVPDYSTDPVKCLTCHADGRLPQTSAKVTVTVSGHTTAANGFTIGTGAHAGAAGGACLTCHPANRLPSTTAPHWEYARDWKQATCTGCHVPVASGAAFHDDAATLRTFHAVTRLVANYDSTVAARGVSAACLYCHADGAGGAPATHPQLFPIAAGTKHAGIACAACHTNPANRKDLNALACASCHNDPTKVKKTMTPAHTITGYRISSYFTATTAGGTRTTVNIDILTKPDGCLRCHADSQVNRVATHPGGDSGFGEADHRTAGCLTCHWKTRSAVPPLPALPKPWGANFKDANGTAGPPPTSCYVCHRNGEG